MSVFKGAIGGVGETHLPKSPRLKVTVKDEMIAEAAKANSSHCMTAVGVVATALAKGISAQSVSVDVQTIRFSDAKKRLRYIYLTPRAVQNAIISWDQGVAIKAFSFTLHGGHVVNMPGKRQGKATKTATALKAASVRGVKPEDTSGRFRRVGGKEPPMPSVSTRREFGLRAYGGPQVPA